MHLKSKMILITLSGDSVWEWLRGSASELDFPRTCVWHFSGSGLTIAWRFAEHLHWQCQGNFVKQLPSDRQARRAEECSTSISWQFPLQGNGPQQFPSQSLGTNIDCFRLCMKATSQTHGAVHAPQWDSSWVVGILRIQGSLLDLLDVFEIALALSTLHWKLRTCVEHNFWNSVRGIYACSRTKTNH